MKQQEQKNNDNITIGDDPSAPQTFTGDMPNKHIHTFIETGGNCTGCGESSITESNMPNKHTDGNKRCKHRYKYSHKEYVNNPTTTSSGLFIGEVDVVVCEKCGDVKRTDICKL